MTDSSLSLSRVLSVALILAFLPAFVPIADGQSSACEVPAYKECIKAFSVGMGSSFSRETYISDLSYSGTSISLQGDSWRGYSPDNIFNNGRTHASVLLGYLKNKPQAGAMLHFSIDYFHARTWSALHTGSSDLLIGPAAMLKIGGLYDMSNSNNTATGEGYLSVGVCADYTWRFRVGSYPLALQAGMFSPLIGAALATDYDEPYWFVYKYNRYGDVIHFAWVGNCLAVNGQVALVCPVMNGRLRLGVNVDYLGNKLGGHLTRLCDTSFTVGYVRNFSIKDWKL